MIASLGDGFLVWIIYLVGWRAFRRPDWFIRPGGLQYGVMLISGLTISIVVEYVAVHTLEHWTYTAYMPLLPGLAIGLVPVAQMLVLPPVIFFIVAVLAQRKRP